MRTLRICAIAAVSLLPVACSDDDSAGGSGGSSGAGAAGGAGSGGSSGSGASGAASGAGGASGKCVYGTTPDQCTTKIKGDLECECPTFVNPGNAAAMSDLATLESAWTTEGCTPSLACACADPTDGSCTPGAGGPADGNCLDS